MIEHHALGLPGRPAGVDKQRKPVVSKVRRIDIGHELTVVQLVSLHHCPRAGVEVRNALDDQHLGVGVKELMADLGRSQ